MHRLLWICVFFLVGCDLNSPSKATDALESKTAQSEPSWLEQSELTFNIEVDVRSPAEILSELAPKISKTSPPKLGSGLAHITSSDFWKAFGAALEAQGGLQNLPQLPPQVQELNILGLTTYGQELKLGERVKIHTRGDFIDSWHEGLIGITNPGPEDKEGFLKLLRATIRSLEGNDPSKERAVLTALGVVGGKISDETKYESDRYRYKVSVLSIQSKVSNIMVRVSPKARDVAPGQRTWFRVDSAKDAIHGHLGSYSVLVDPETKGQGFFAAAESCEKQGMVLCTAPQWRAACRIQPSLGKVETWTASLTDDYKGHQIQGGAGRCEAAGGAGSHESKEGRYGVCCSDAIALGEDDTHRMHLIGVKALERGTNTKSPEVLGDAFAERVVSFHTLANPSKSEAVKAVMNHVSSIPDFRIRHEQCTLENVSTITTRFRCEKLAFWGGKALVIHSDYIVDKLGQILYAQDQRILRKHRAVEGSPQVSLPSHPLLTSWVNAQNEGNFEAYASLYSNDFSGVKNVKGQRTSFDRTGWLKDRKGMFNASFTVQVSNVEVKKQGDLEILTFAQTWKSDTYEDTGTKEVHSRNGKIVKEEQLSSGVSLPGPSEAEWASVGEVTVKGSSELRCVTKVLGGYFKAECSENNFGAPSGVSLLAGTQEGIARLEKGKLILVHPYREGISFAAKFSWAGGSQKLKVHWPYGAPKPGMTGEFTE